MTKPFTYDALPGRVLFGSGAARTRLAAELVRLGMGRLLLIASPRERAQAAELAAPFAARVAGVWDELRSHVPLELAEAARERARSLGADGLLALGGGSAIGLAKAIALELGLPIVAVPTTYAGSEMTPIYGLTSGGQKRTGRSPAVLPRLVLYDPELTLSLPPQVSGPSAINAVAHCVEALYAPGASPVTSLLAVEGLGALARGAPAVVARPAELAAREQTLYGAYLAGAALAAAGTALHHKLCHILGGAYNLPHAELHSVVLPHAVAFNEPQLRHELAPARAALGAADGISTATALFELARSVGAPASLRELGLTEAQLDAVLPTVLAQLPADNPRPLDADAVAALLRDAFEGHRP